MDLAIIETGNGGDLQLVGNDLATVEGYENMPYLGMFGGNNDDTEWWGNNLLMPANESIQFISVVEKTLNSTGLTSAGRITIENAIKTDLEFMAVFAEVKVNVTIIATDKITVNIGIVLLDGTRNVTVVNFKKISNGDFFILDFNNDFFL